MSAPQLAVRRRLPRAERRAQLIEAAAAAFLRGGFDGTSMEDVARAAGVTRLIVYRIFETKEELYRAVLIKVIEDLDAAFGASGTEQRLLRQGVARLLVDVARRQPDGFRLLWRHAAHEPAFTEIGAQFRSGVQQYSSTLLGLAGIPVSSRGWASQAVAAYFYEGICAWLDDHQPADRDDELVTLLAAGSRAIVAAWSAAR